MGKVYDQKKNEGDVFNYYTCGAGCSLVEIDCLTGFHTVLSTDIVMDLGASLNPAIDIGQIEGAFAQVRNHIDRSKHLTLSSYAAGDKFVK